MSSEKRRRARIQGGWAAPRDRTQKPSPATKPASSAAPAWLGQNADGNEKPALKEYVFEEPAQPVRQKPKERVIDKAGVYELSTEPTGPSRLRYFPQFLDPKDLEWMFDQLFHELPWRQRMNSKLGENFVEPRLTTWFGDVPYTYSGVTWDPNPNWTPFLNMLRDRLEEITGVRFNSVLGNLYRDGHDSVSWHSDDEPALGHCPTIASLSFGDTRNFELRKKPPKEDEGDYTYMEHVRVPLEGGSLLIMEGATQEDWQHRVPREYHDRSARINLTFRVMYPT